MKRVMSLLLIATLGWTAPAQEVDPLENALRILRGRVIFNDVSPVGRLNDAGLTTALLGVPALIFGGMVNLHGRTFGQPLTHLHRLMWLAAPIGMIGGGVGLMVYAKKWRARYPAPARVVEAPAHYQTVDGLNDFMGLTPEQQNDLAKANPDFADFLLRLADAYTFIIENRFTPDIPVGGPK